MREPNKAPCGKWKRFLECGKVAPRGRQKNAVTHPTPSDETSPPSPPLSLLVHGLECLRRKLTISDSFFELHLNCSACVDNVFEISETSTKHTRAHPRTHPYARAAGKSAAQILRRAARLNEPGVRPEGGRPTPAAVKWA